MAPKLSVWILFLVCVKTVYTLGLEPLKATWDDAHSTCSSNSHILVPGRSYRYKWLLKIIPDGDSVWIYGWRAVTNGDQDSNGRVKSLKVDFTRSSKKALPFICQNGNAYTLSTTAGSVEDAAAQCNTEGSEFAKILSSNDYTSVMDIMNVDSPTWASDIDPIDKGKHCLMVTNKAGKLKYTYVDCKEEHHYICLTDDKIISSFMPLMALKMTSYNEVKGLIQDELQTSSSSVIVSSTPAFETSSSIAESIDSSTSSIPSITVTDSPPVTSSSSTDKMVDSTGTTDSSDITPSPTSSAMPITKDSTSTTILAETSTMSLTDSSMTSSTASDKVMDSTSTTDSAGIIPSSTETGTMYMTKDTILSESSSSAIDSSKIIPSPAETSTISMTQDTASTSTVPESSSSGIDSPDTIPSATEASSMPMIKDTTSTTTLPESSSSTKVSTGIIPSATEASSMPMIKDTTSTTTLPESSSSTKDSIGIIPTPSETSSMSMAQDTTSTTMLPDESSSIIDSPEISPSLTETSTMSMKIDTTSTTILTDSSSSHIVTHPEISPSSTETSHIVKDTTSATILPDDSSSSVIDISEFPHSPTETSILTEDIFSTTSMSFSSDLESSTLTFEESSSSDVLQPTPVIDSVESSDVIESVSSSSSAVSDSDSVVINPTSSSDTMQTSSYTPFSDIINIGMSDIELGSSNIEATSTIVATSVDSITPIMTDASSSTAVVITPISSSADLIEIDSSTQNVYTISGIDQTQSSATPSLDTSYITLSSTPSIIVSPHSALSSSSVSPSLYSSTSGYVGVTSPQSITPDVVTPEYSSDIPMPDTTVPTTPDNMADNVTTDSADSGDMYSTTDSAIVTGKIDYETTTTSPENVTASTSDGLNIDDYTTTGEHVKRVNTSDIDTTRVYNTTTSRGDLDVDVTIDTGDEDSSDEDEDFNETNEAVSEEKTDDSQGLETSLWVAFVILVVAVIFSIVLAVYLYRRRQKQKSKDITAVGNGAAAPPASGAAGEDVELRDSRSLTNNRDSTTYRDTAYDL